MGPDFSQSPFTRACDELTIAGDGMAAGASVSLQRLLKAAARGGLGGLAYLHSVPGNVGGAVCMNAGRGRRFRESIGDSVESVTCFNGRDVITVKKRRCAFEHRRSVFHSMPGAVILGATLRMRRCGAGVAERQLRERIAFAKERQDGGRPNAGTVYKLGNKLSSELRGVRVGRASFSEKTKNWIVNEGGGHPQDIVRLLEVAAAAHAGLGMAAPELEWTRW